ncbi:TRAP transporter small permease [Sporosarcina thermotolerans]|uniref:TRAP transporter small permease n=1 Tax=Sporosarcina thermotolerans TaxID=633404 RepID=A0AAW9A4Z8_9BACL|nr:TRAP transporter small permease [Sporosarcina thermotolerans]MDW0116207.1 TRAP transporter small permease [Sporosarcina thermotolerans]WHT48183.1 TRAP transporter small permease [Sporosarcina thermotolerans]
MFFLKWIDRINKFFEVLVAIAFLLMTVFIALQVIVRFVFTSFDLNISVPWTEELSRYLMIWAVFLGGALAMRRDSMIQVDPFVNALPGAIGKTIKVVSLLLTASFFMFLFILGYQYVIQGMGQMSPVMRIPMAVTYLAIPVGSFVMILNIIALFIEAHVTKKDIRYLSTVDEEKYLDDIKEN